MFCLHQIRILRPESVSYLFILQIDFFLVFRHWIGNSSNYVDQLSGFSIIV